MGTFCFMSIGEGPQIGAVIRNAFAFHVRNWSGVTMNPDLLLQTVQEFFSLLAVRKIDYVLVGGIAMLHYVEGRNTESLDIFMSIGDLARLPELQISLEDHDLVRANYNNLRIDVLLDRNQFFEKIRREYACTEVFFNQPITLSTVEGLIILKLYALPSIYRRGNFARVGLYENDVATLLHYYPTDETRLLEILSPFMNAADLSEVRNLLKEIQQRFRRFEEGLG